VTGNRALHNLTRDVTAKLQDVEFLACYSAGVARLVGRREKWAKWLVAAAACVPFVARLREVSGPVADWVVAVIPLLAVGLPVWRPEKTIGTASMLHGRYLQVLPALRALWRRLRDFEGPSEATSTLVTEAARELETLEQELASIRSKSSGLPDIGRLKRRCKSSVPDYARLETEPRREDNDVGYKMGN
jgi:hypothetical protein